MHKILIIWGGWCGHHPEEFANKLAKLLIKQRYEVTTTCDFAVLINENLNHYDLIIPIWSCGITSKYYSQALLKAIKNGVSLATFHGGIKWFEDEEYYNMIGALYLYDSPQNQYTINISDVEHEIISNIKDFSIISEKYFMQVDPGNIILAKADFNTVKMPIAWIKEYGKGRVFYSALAHSPEQFFSTPCITMFIQGVQWCLNK